MESLAAVFETIVGIALDPVIATDRRDRVVHWNRHAERIFGWTAQEAIGQPLHELIIPQRDRRRHVEGVQRFNATGEVHVLGRRRELTAVRRDGTEIAVELALMIAPQSKGDIFVGFLRDLTPQKEAEREIAQLQSDIVHLSRVNAMSTMASVLAHELNQPLAAAASYLASARKLRDLPPMDGAPTPWETVESAQKAVHRAGETIRSIRQMVNNGPSTREYVRVTELIGETERLMKGSLRVRPTVDIEGDADCVFVSRVQIEQVLLNLLRNANEALESQSEPVIEITARTSGAQVRLTVADNGSGLPPEVKERLFSTAPTRKEAGMGIGLSVCRTIVEQHDGTIWHHEENGRTSFSFTVPRERDPASSTPSH